MIGWINEGRSGLSELAASRGWPNGLAHSAPPYSGAAATMIQLQRVFTAMSLHRLGKHERARAVLTDLRATMKLPAFAKDEQNLAFLREAEALLGDKEPMKE